MLLWVMIIVILSVIAFVYIKFESSFSFVKNILFGLLLLLLVLAMVVVFRSGQVDLSSPSGVFNGIYVCIQWLAEFVVTLWDIGADVTGKVIDVVNMSDSSSFNR